MIGDGQLERLKRRSDSDPDDLEALLRYIDGLRRLERPFLDLALHGVSKGIPIGPQGIQRDWFRPYWKPFTYWKGESKETELAGPFVDLSHRSLNIAEVTNFDLRYACFHRSELMNLEISQCQLQHSDFTDCDLGNFNGSVPISTQFSDVDASDCKFENSNLQGATFLDSQLSRACYRQAKMAGARLQTSNFADADFSLAQLDACRAYDCDFHTARFDGASMDGLIFDLETKWPADFDPFSHGALAEM